MHDLNQRGEADTHQPHLGAQHVVDLRLLALLQHHVQRQALDVGWQLQVLAHSAALELCQRGLQAGTASQLRLYIPGHFCTLCYISNDV